MKSTMSVSVMSVPHEPVSGSLLLTSATLPAVALMLTSPVTFGVGRAVPAAPPDARPTRKYSPGPMMPPIGAIAAQSAVLVADAYWTVQPDMSTALPVGLYSSTKSLLYVALVLPPPPYT